MSVLCWRAIWKLRRNAIKTWERHLRAVKLQAFLCCCLCQQVGCVLPGATQASAGSSPNAAFLGDLAPASSTSASNPYQGWEREGREATGPGQQEQECIGAIAPQARGHTRARAGRAVPLGGPGWGRHRRDPAGSPRGAILCWGLSFALPFWVAAILRPGSSPGCAAPYPCRANACWGLLTLPSPCGHLPGAGRPGAPTLSLGTQLPRPPQPPRLPSARP